MSFQPEWDIPLLIGAVLIFLRGGDLLLREHQRKALQKGFEHFTLWLEEMRPHHWPVFLSRPLIAFLFSIAFLITWFAAMLYDGSSRIGQLEWLLSSSLFGPQSFHLHSDKLQDWWANHDVALLGLTILLCVMISIKLLPLTIQYLCAHGNYGIFYIRLVGFYLAWFILQLCFASVIDVMCHVADLVPILLWPFAIITICYSAVGLIMFGILVLNSIWIGLYILEFTTRFFRAVCWRIVEYQKGVWGALLVIMQITLLSLRLLLFRD